MPTQMKEKVQFLTDEVTGLQARMQGKFNQAQSRKLELLSSIRDDYVKSLEKAERAKGD